MRISKLMVGFTIMLISQLLVSVPAQRLELDVLGTFETGIFDDSAAEIVAHDPASQRLFFVNGSNSTVDVLDISDPSSPTQINSFDISSFGGGINSVDVKNGVVAAAVEANTVTDPGSVVFFDIDGNFLGSVTVGALPDMLVFTEDGNKILVANEGEPDAGVDPEGSISIIDISGGIKSAKVCTAGFSSFNAPMAVGLDPSIRIFGPGATVAQDLEPEYIALSPDGDTAFVSLQENNGIAVVDIDTATVTELQGLGFKDHSQTANALDASDRDDAINIQTWPVFGMYQPDAIAAMDYKGQTYYLTANEGDARGFEEERVSDLTLDPTAFPTAATLQMDANLGRLEVTNTLGDTDSDGDFDELYVYGARSMSVYNASTGAQVFDSGSFFERLTANRDPLNFNSSNDDNDDFDSRSDAKGPEPEGIVLARTSGRTFAIVGLERVGGVVVYDVTNPTAPNFVNYTNNRDFSEDAETGNPGDLGPEGLAFISACDSPNGKDILITSNEVSGTVTLFDFRYTDRTRGPFNRRPDCGSKADEREKQIKASKQTVSSKG